MHTNWLGCLVSLAAFTAAVPTRPSASKGPAKVGSFKVERVANPNYNGRDGPHALYRALNKHGAVIPQGLQSHIDRKNALAATGSRMPLATVVIVEEEIVANAGHVATFLTTVTRTISAARPVKTSHSVVASSANTGASSWASSTGQSSVAQISAARSSLAHAGSILPSHVSSTSSSSVSPSSAPSSAGLVKSLASAATAVSSAQPLASGQSGSNQVGTVPNAPTVNDVAYLSPITIGGSQTLLMDFDTGSSDLWVFGPGVQIVGSGAAVSAVSAHSTFNPANSSTFQLMAGAEFSVLYGDRSSANGMVGTDRVTIGGVTVPQQAVEVATRATASFLNNDSPMAGLVGLAFSSLNRVRPTQQKTFFDNVHASLDAPVFTADLRHGSPGIYEFGAVDASRFTGSLQYADVHDHSGFWIVESSQFSVGSSAAVQSIPNGLAIVDTGTTLLMVFRTVADAYFGQVVGARWVEQQASYTVPCDAVLPDLHLGFGPGSNQMAVVRGSDLLFILSDQHNVCFPGLQVATGAYMIFGDMFLKSNFVVFDAGNNRVGFAPHA